MTTFSPRTQWRRLISRSQRFCIPELPDIRVWRAFGCIIGGMEGLREQLQNLFGLDDFRPAQREVIEDVLRGKDVLCVMPTGAGKSLCYQLPATIRRGLSIVVSPLISLMEDQVQQLRDEGIAASFLNSALSAALRRQVMQELEEGFGGLLYVAPERFFSADFQELMPRLQVKDRKSTRLNS